MKAHGYSKLAEWVEYELKIANYDDSPEKIKKFSDLILIIKEIKLHIN